MQPTAAKCGWTSTRPACGPRAQRPRSDQRGRGGRRRAYPVRRRGGCSRRCRTDQRHVVAAGDLVWFRPEGADEGIIERVEPRHGVLSRTSRGRQHISGRQRRSDADRHQRRRAATQAEPDRPLPVTAEKSRIQPIICINKIDLVDPADLQPLVGVYGQMGYA